MSGAEKATLTGIEWAQLLCEHPKLAGVCDWEAFDGNAWHCLLCRRPEFAERCDWTFAKEWNRWYWATLLAMQPQFADKCPVRDEFDGIERHWVGKLKGEHRKMFADWRCMDGRRGKILALLLKAKPEAASGSCTKGFVKQDWIVLLQTLDNVPQNILGRCPWGRFRATDWMSLLSSEMAGKYADRCPWGTFDIDDWREILYGHKEFRKEFDAHSQLKYEDLDLDNWEPDWWTW